MATRTPNVELLDGAEAHLEHGMAHVGYDADEQTNTYRDKDGNLWQSQPGNQYGPLHMTQRAKGPQPQKSSDRLFSAQPSVRSSRRDSKVETSGLHKSADDALLDLKRAGQAPPAYQTHRRFTSFDMLDDGKDKSGGLLSRLGRSLSLKAPQSRAVDRRMSTRLSRVGEAEHSSSGQNKADSHTQHKPGEEAKRNQRKKGEMDRRGTI